MTVAEGVNEREKERRNGVLRERKKELLGKGEGGGSDGGAGDRNGIFKSVSGEIELFEGDVVGD